MSEFDYMAPKIAAKHTKGHRFALITLLIVGGFVTLFFLWASFAEIDVVTRGQGQVIPSQKTQVIAHLEGGVVKEILVKEGDLVEAGQVLMLIDPTVAESKYKTNKEQYLRYIATNARLQAQLNNQEYKVPEEVKTESPLIATESEEHYIQRTQQFNTQKSIAEATVKQKKQELEEDKERLAQSQEQLTLAQEELEMVSPLVAEELISKREILRLKRDVANLKGEVSKAKAAVAKDQAALTQAEQELIQVTNRFRMEDEEQLKELKIKLAEEQGEVRESKDRLARTEIRSPVKGIVKELKIKTVGGVARAGEDIITVVPFEDTLLVEAKVLPSDVAFLHPGQETTVKVTAYDYVIYGSLTGQLLKISADTVYDQEQKKDFYRVLVQTDKNYLEYKGKKLAIIPGMVVDVDVLTGERTVLQYLMKPFIRGAKESFSER